MRHLRENEARRTDLRVIQRAPHGPVTRECSEGVQLNHGRRGQNDYDEYGHFTYAQALPIHAALRHPPRSPGCPQMLRMVVFIVCACGCFLIFAIAIATMSYVLPTEEQPTNERFTKDMPTDIMHRAALTLGVGAGVRSLHPTLPSPSLSPSLSPSPPSALSLESRNDELAFADGAWRRAVRTTRAPEQLLIVLDGLAEASGDGRFVTELDWARTMAELPEWRQGGSYEDLDERAALGDLVRLIHYLNQMLRFQSYELRKLSGEVQAQRDEMRNLTRAAGLRKHVRASTRPGVRAASQDAAWDHTLNKSAHTPQ